MADLRESIGRRTVSRRTIVGRLQRRAEQRDDLGRQRATIGSGSGAKLPVEFGRYLTNMQLGHGTIVVPLWDRASSVPCPDMDDPPSAARPPT